MTAVTVTPCSGYHLLPRDWCATFVRWALEEADLEYDVRLMDRQDQSSASYRRLQPFGQVARI